MGEIERIANKVKAQLKMLDLHDTYRNEHFKGRIDRENSRDKPRVTYLADYNKSFTDSIRIGIATRDLLNLTVEWNIAKAELDLHAQGKQESFELALIELVKIKPKGLFKQCAKIKALRSWRMFDGPLRSDLLSQYEFMRRVYKNAPTHLKRMGRSDAQNAAADRQSLAMKMKWGSY